jgi:hypothetical protein
LGLLLFCSIDAVFPLQAGTSGETAFLIFHISIALPTMLIEKGLDVLHPPGNAPFGEFDRLWIFAGFYAGIPSGTADGEDRRDWLFGLFVADDLVEPEKSSQGKELLHSIASLFNFIQRLSLNLEAILKGSMVRLWHMPNKNGKYQCMIYF